MSALTEGISHLGLTVPGPDSATKFFPLAQHLGTLDFGGVSDGPKLQYRDLPCHVQFLG